MFNCFFADMAVKAGEPDQLKIGAAHFKFHRTAASLLKTALFPDVSGAARGELNSELNVV